MKDTEEEGCEGEEEEEKANENDDETEWEKRNENKKNKKIWRQLEDKRWKPTIPVGADKHLASNRISRVIFFFKKKGK